MTFSGALATKERSANCRRSRTTGRMITHAAALKRKRAIGSAQQRRNSRTRPESADVIGRAPRIRAFHPISGNELVDETRIPLHHGVRTEPPPFQCRAPKVCDEDICIGKEFKSKRLTLGSSKIDSDRLLRTVVHFEHRIVRHHRSEKCLVRARGITDARWLKFDYVSTPVSQNPCARGSCDPHTKFDDFHIL